MSVNLAAARAGEPAEAQWIDFAPLPPEPADSAVPLKLPANPLLDVKTRLQVCVGEALVTVGELLGAPVGHVVALDRAVDDPVDILVEGRVVARGQLVAVGDRFGIRITEPPLPLKP